MAVDDGRNLTEAARSTQSQARFTFKPRTVLNHRATRTHNRHVWVSAHHGCDEVLESVNEGRSTLSQVKFTFTPRANI